MPKLKAKWDNNKIIYYIYSGKNKGEIKKIIYLLNEKSKINQRINQICLKYTLYSLNIMDFAFEFNYQEREWERDYIV